jgi:protein-L-isoaspartate(D-aspartate) O-methyltransferase
MNPPSSSPNRRRPFKTISVVFLTTALFVGCAGDNGAHPKSEGAGFQKPSEGDRAARLRMVHETIEKRGIKNPRVLEAMRAEPREAYMPKEKHVYAYDDCAVQIGWDQTISRPYIVALMTNLLNVEPKSRVLEIGTGSGYQASILDRMGAKVFSIEIVKPLSAQAAKSLKKAGHGNIQLRCGDGYKGWPSEAPFDRIILTAAPPKIPQALIDQLKVGGRLVAPEGDQSQVLVVIDRLQDGTLRRQTYRDVKFVPMVHSDVSAKAAAVTSGN